ncbi:uncharacterized protein IWZ02DRAFT_134098 [Phyllosticta citriasiana]|uniref:uncharacterized protein n=1 Tax=Phyllosticta citriasiana TaxID=595635 RepID=UPI0030FDB61B
MDDIFITTLQQQLPAYLAKGKFLTPLVHSCQPLPCFVATDPTLRLAGLIATCHYLLVSDPLDRGFVNLVPLVCDGSAIQRSTSVSSNLQQYKILGIFAPRWQIAPQGQRAVSCPMSKRFCCPRPLQPVVGHGGACRRRSLAHEIPQKMRQGSTDLKALQHDTLSVFQGRIQGAFLQTQARSLVVSTSRANIPKAGWPSQKREKDAVLIPSSFCAFWLPSAGATWNE